MFRLIMFTSLIHSSGKNYSKNYSIDAMNNSVTTWAEQGNYPAIAINIVNS